MQHYGAKLLFQYRIRKAGRDNKLRVCEERIVRFSAQSDRVAETKANRYGKSEQWTHDTSYGARVFFEYIGVIDMNSFPEPVHIEAASFVEVWYEHYDRLLPLERKEQLLRPSTEFSLRGGLAKRKMAVYER